MSQNSVYDQLGPDTLKQLVDEFYHRVEQDPQLRPLFPDDLEAGKEGQYLFLVQYFGGPALFSQQRGQPMLRARHLPFAIGQRERDLWFGHMMAAIEALNIPKPSRAIMEEYFERAATFMINQAETTHPTLRFIKP